MLMGTATKDGLTALQIRAVSCSETGQVAHRRWPAAGQWPAPQHKAAPSTPGLVPQRAQGLQSLPPLYAPSQADHAQA